MKEEDTGVQNNTKEKSEMLYIIERRCLDDCSLPNVRLSNVYICSKGKHLEG